jgi:hypothetical protein
VRDYPALRNVQGIQAFLGLDSYYRRIVPGFAEATKPISEMTSKDPTVYVGSKSTEGV